MLILQLFQMVELVFEVGALNVPIIAVSVKSIEQNHSFVVDAKVGYHVNFL